MKHTFLVAVLAAILAPCAFAQSAPPAVHEGAKANLTTFSVPSVKEIVAMAYAIHRTYPSAYATISIRARILAGPYYSNQRTVVNALYPPDLRSEATMIYALHALTEDPSQPAQERKEASEIIGGLGLVVGGFFTPNEVACMVANLGKSAASAGRACSR